MINFRVRIKNKAFWCFMVPTVCLLIEQVLAMFGVKIELDAVSKQLVDIINTVFLLLAAIGIVNDPTTAGVADSTQAMTYEVPKEK